MHVLFVFQISLDLSNSEKFSSLLRVALEVLSQLLEVACLPEIARHTEDLLGYLRATVARESTASVLCVQQVRGKAGRQEAMMKQWGILGAGGL